MQESAVWVLEIGYGVREKMPPKSIDEREVKYFTVSGIEVKIAHADDNFDDISKDSEVFPFSSSEQFSSLKLNSDDSLTLSASISNLTKAILTWSEAVSKAVRLYPNKRVVHLALYAKKSRTRKKNLNRILKGVKK